MFTLPIFVLSFPMLFATAVPTQPGGNQQCNTGSLQCCNELQQPYSGGLLNILGPITGLIGLGCTPITVIGLGQGACTQQPACCEGNQENGLINVNCVPISL